MVRIYKKQSLNGTYRKILEHLGKGSPTPKILEELNIKYENYYKKINFLEKYNYITKKRLGKILNFELQPKAIKLLSGGIERVKSGRKISIHDVWIAFRILKKPIEWNDNFIEQTLQSNAIQYHTHEPNNWKGFFFDYASFIVRVTPNKIMLHAPEVVISEKDSIEDIKNMLVQDAYRLMPKMERLFSVSLSKPDKVSVSVASQHIAFINNMLAKYFTDRNIKLLIKAEDGKARVLIDKSNGNDELECVHKAYAEEDAEKLQVLINDTITGTFDPRQLQKDIRAVVDNQLMFAQNLEAHILAINKLGNGVEKLTAIIEKLEKPKYDHFSKIKGRFLR